MSRTSQGSVAVPHGAALSARSRTGRLLAGAVAATVVAGGLTLVDSTSAVAATAAAPSTSKPLAQSVGNFLDATLGGNTLDSIAKLKYATARAPGAQSVQNPLDATVLNAIDLPLTGALQLGAGQKALQLGAVNQIAKANVDGSSLGASGAVSNSGGVSIGGDNNAYPANAMINLSAAALSSNSPIPVPGGGSASALGGVTANIGAVAATASTPKGVDKGSSTSYQIASLNLKIGSPLLGRVLSNVLAAVTNGLSTVVTSLTSAIGQLAPLPPDCSLTSPTAITKPISLEGGAMVIDPTNASITIDLEALLKVLGLDLNKMPANTDLLAYLLAYLADPNGLNKGVQGIVNGLTGPLQDQFTACSAALNAIPALGPILSKLAPLLTQGQKSLEDAITGLVSQIAGAAGVNPLAPLADVLQKLLDIGVNVQPNGPAGPKNAAYTDHLAATPKQGTPVVPGQTVERAIEINVAAAAGSGLPGLPSIPGLGSLPIPSAFAKPVDAAPAANSGILTLALANAAAGPSSAAAAPPASTTPASPQPPNRIPTGVPAGMSDHGGTPLAPVVLLIVAVLTAGAGAVSWRVRGRHLS